MDCQWRLAMLTFLICACQPVATPLLEVNAVEPSAAEMDDVLTLRGEGFAEGATAHVQFSGVVWRAGDAPADSFVARTLAKATSKTELEVTLDRKLISQFAGEGSRHATFSGKVSVAFASRLEGAPPVTGVSQLVVLDFFSDLERETKAASTKQPEEFFGLKVLPHQGGLRVTFVEPANRAAQAGIERGDIIRSFGGLSTFDVKDLEPHPGQRAAVIGVWRKAEGARNLTLDCAGFSPPDARGWAPGLTLLAAGLIVFLLFRGLVLRLVAFVELRRAQARRRSRAPRRTVVRTLLRARVSLVLFLAVSALFALIGLRAVGIASEFDLVLLYAASAACLSVAQFLSGGLVFPGKTSLISDAPPTWSLVRGIRASGRCLVWHVIVGLALLSVVMESGTLGLNPVAIEETGLSGIRLFSSPSSFLAGTVLLVAIFVEGLVRYHKGTDRRGTTKQVQEDKRSLARQLGPKGIQAVAQGLRNFHALVLIGMVAVLFFGGFTFFGLPTSNMFGVLWFQVKFSLIYVAYVALRETVPSVPFRALLGGATKVLVPASTVAVLVVPIWAVLSVPRWFSESLAWSSLLALALFLAYAFFRLRKRIELDSAQGLNPWV